MTVIAGMIVGLSAGALYSLIGVGLTLMSSLTRVVNFSIVGVGVFGAFMSIRLIPLGVPGPLVVVAAIVISAALSALLGWIETVWLSEASTTARSAVTVASLLLLISLSYLLFGSRPQPLRPLLIGPAFQVQNIAVTQVGLAMLVTTIVVAVGAQLLISRTPIGIQLRAVSDRPTTAETLGVNVRVLHVGVWAVVGGVMGLAVSIIGNTQAADATSMISLLIPGTAAALIGAFRSLPLAVLGGLLVGALQGALTSSPATILLRDWIPIVVIVLFLLWNQRKEVWDVAR